VHSRSVHRWSSQITTTHFTALKLFFCSRKKRQTFLQYIHAWMDGNSQSFTENFDFDIRLTTYNLGNSNFHIFILFFLKGGPSECNLVVGTRALEPPCSLNRPSGSKLRFQAHPCCYILPKDVGLTSGRKGLRFASFKIKSYKQNRFGSIDRQIPN